MPNDQQRGRTYRVKVYEWIIFLSLSIGVPACGVVLATEAGYTSLEFGGPLHMIAVVLWIAGTLISVVAMSRRRAAVEKGAKQEKLKRIRSKYRMLEDSNNDH